MKLSDESKVVLALLVLFILVQSMGIYLGMKLITIPELEPATGAEWGGFLFLYILFATGVILVVIKYVKKLLLVLEALTIFFSTEIFFEVLLMGFVPADVGAGIAVLLALLLVVLRFFERNIWTQNLALLLSVMGVGALLGASLGVLPALVLLGLLTVYDVIAVFKTKHMVKMAKAIVKQKLAFTFAIPTKKHVFQLGGGDLVMPLVFTISVLREFGLGNALFVMFFSMLALMALFGYLVKRPGKAYPALPPVTIGAITGFMLSILLFQVWGIL